jgi:hypothetical protein
MTSGEQMWQKSILGMPEVSVLWINHATHAGWEEAAQRLLETWIGVESRARMVMVTVHG